MFVILTMNDNITVDVLNGSGVHLGKKGTSMLAKNIITHIVDF